MLRRQLPLGQYVGGWQYCVGALSHTDHSAQCTVTSNVLLSELSKFKLISKVSKVKKMGKLRQKQGLLHLKVGFGSTSARTQMCTAALWTQLGSVCVVVTLTNAGDQCVPVTSIDAGARLLSLPSLVWRPRLTASHQHEVRAHWTNGTLLYLPAISQQDPHTIIVYMSHTHSVTWTSTSRSLLCPYQP